MNRKHIALASLAASALPAPAVAITTGPTVAATATSRGVGTEVLNLLCESKGGTTYVTPYTIARCQTAHARAGVEVEQLVCEGLLGGRFAVVTTPGRPHRVNWACVAGAPDA